MYTFSDLEEKYACERFLQEINMNHIETPDYVGNCSFLLWDSLNRRTYILRNDEKFRIEVSPITTEIKVGDSVKKRCYYCVNAFIRSYNIALFVGRNLVLGWISHEDIVQGIKEELFHLLTEYLYYGGECSVKSELLKISSANYKYTKTKLQFDNQQEINNFNTVFKELTGFSKSLEFLSNPIIIKVDDQHFQDGYKTYPFKYENRTIKVTTCEVESLLGFKISTADCDYVLIFDGEFIYGWSIVLYHRIERNNYDMMYIMIYYIMHPTDEQACEYINKYNNLMCKRLDPETLRRCVDRTCELRDLRGEVVYDNICGVDLDDRIVDLTEYNFNTTFDSSVNLNNDTFNILPLSESAIYIEVRSVFNLTVLVHLSPIGYALVIPIYGVLPPMPVYLYTALFALSYAKFCVEQDEEGKANCLKIVKQWLALSSLDKKKVDAESLLNAILNKEGAGLVKNDNKLKRICEDYCKTLKEMCSTFEIDYTNVILSEEYRSIKKDVQSITENLKKISNKVNDKEC